jgi:hypothetical protein
MTFDEQGGIVERLVCPFSVFFVVYCTNATKRPAQFNFVLVPSHQVRK